MKRRRLAGARAAATMLLLAAGCGGARPDAPAAGDPEGAAAPAAPWLVDVTAAGGLDFRHHNGMTGDRYFPEMMGAGAALADVDGDGDLDAFLAQGAPLSPGAAAAPTAADPALASPLAWRDRLYLNGMNAGDPASLRFADATEASGIMETGYGMGVAAGDADGDGNLDLYVTNWDGNRFWAGLGGGRFADATAATGTGNGVWSVGAGFADLDRDGRLDLYVVDYVDYRYASHQPCYAASGRVDYCSPKAYRPLPAHLYLNRAAGMWEDAAGRLGLGLPGSGLGAQAADLDGDGLLDLYVANDQMENRLWLGRPDGGFVDRAPQAGVAVGGDGKAEASMGLAAADWDGDADMDLFLTSLDGETNTLYRHDGGGLFSDQTEAAGLGRSSLPDTSFGVADVDLDMDGWLDLVVINGAVVLEAEQVAAGEPYPLQQPSRVYHNQGGGRFVDVTAQAAPELALPAVGRGVAAGDVDNDGDADLLVTRNNGPALLLRNDAAGRHPWLGLRLLDPGGRRDALGATVRLLAPEHPPGAAQLRRAATDGSYASAKDPRVLLALPDGATAADVAVVWPDGRTETFRALAVRRYHTLTQGASGGRPTTTR